MSNFNSTIFFWLVWGVISVWVLKTFYFAAREKYIRRLRRTGFGLNFLALILFFLPWLPATGASGWELVKTGQGLAMLEFGIIALAAVLCFSASSLANKTGAVLQGGAMVLFIALMIKLIPGTYILNVNLVAPIIASLLLIINFVVALLLWHQLQLKEKA